LYPVKLAYTIDLLRYRQKEFPTGKAGIFLGRHTTHSVSGHSSRNLCTKKLKIWIADLKMLNNI